MMDIIGVDLLTVSISTGVFLLLASLLYVFSIYGVREKTYEEALEEQRKRNEANVHQSKNEKSDKFSREKKFKKPWGKRAKEKNQSDKENSGTELNSQHHEHVVFKPETEVIPTEYENNALKSGGKSKKNKKSKPILVNKDEGSPKKESQILNSEEEIERQRSNSFNLTKPRDEIELKHLQEISDGAKNESAFVETQASVPDSTRQRKKAHKPEDKPKNDSDQEVKKESVSPVHTPVKKQKRGKNDLANLTVDSFPAHQLVQVLKNSILTDVEIQQLIDILLNRQQSGNNEWTKKGDPIVVLKKQLQEKEQALEDEQRLAQSASSKLKELRAELVSEKSRSSHVERQLNSKLQTQQQELQALHARICHSRDQHVAETSTLQNQIKQVQSAMNDERLSLQRLQDENNRLKEALSIREAEATNLSSMQHLQVEVDKLRSSQEQYEARQASLSQTNNELRCQLDQFKNMEASLKQDEMKYKQHINDLNNKLNQLENTKQTLVQDLQVVQNNANQNENKCRELHASILTLEKQLNESEEKCKEVSLKYDEKNSEQDSILKNNNSFKLQISELRGALESANMQLNNALVENKTLQEEFSKKDADLKVNGDLNNEVNNTVALDLHEKIIGEKSGVISNLEEKLNRLSGELSSKTDELEKQKDKNNEKIIKAIIEEQNKLKKSLEEILPSVDIPSSLKFNDWLVQFKNIAKEELLKISSAECHENSDSNLLDSLTSLEDENSKLESQCEKYKSSLLVTETMLQKLQSSVELSEKAWKEKIVELESKLDKISTERNSLSSKMSEVQVSQDMQAELKNLESKLQSEEIERKSLSEKYQQADKSANELKDKLQNISSEMESLQQQQSSIDSIKTELESVKSQLEKEKKSNKELATETVKLNSLVKIGQDSLKAEMNLVNNLKAEIQSLKSNSSNGSTPHNNDMINSGSPIKESLESNSQAIKKEKSSKKKRGGSGKK